MKRFLCLMYLLCTALLVSCGGGGKSSLNLESAERSDFEAVLAGADLLEVGEEIAASEPPTSTPGTTVILASEVGITRGASAVVIPDGPGDTTDDCWVVGICNLTNRFWNTDCVDDGADVTYLAKVLFNKEDCIKAGYEVSFSRDGGPVLGTALTDADGMATFTETNVPIGVHTSTVCVTDYLPAGDVNGDGIDDPAPVAYCADLVFTVYNPCCCFCGKGTGKIDSAFPNCDSAQFHFKLCYNNGKVRGKFNFRDGDLRFQNEQITWAAAADNELHFGNGAVYIRVGNHGHPGQGTDFFEVYVWDTGNGEYHNSGLLTHGNVMRKSNKNKTGFGCACKCDSHGGDVCEDGCDKGKKPAKAKCSKCGLNDCPKRDRCKDDKQPKCNQCDKRDCKDKDRCDNPKCSKCDKRDCKDKHQCNKPKCKQCGDRDCRSKDKCKDDDKKSKCNKCGKDDCRDKHKCDKIKCSKCGNTKCKAKHRCGGLKSILKDWFSRR